MEPLASSNKHRPEDSKGSTEPAKERPDHLAGGILLGASVLVLLALMGQTSRERGHALPATVAVPKVKYEPDPFIGYVPVKEIEPLKVKAKPTRDRRVVARAIFAGLAVFFATVLLLTLVEPLLAR